MTRNVYYLAVPIVLLLAIAAFALFKTSDARAWTCQPFPQCLIPEITATPTPTPSPTPDCDEREFGLYCPGDPSPVDDPNNESNDPGDETDCSPESGISTERRLNDCGHEPTPTPAAQQGEPRSSEQEASATVRARSGFAQEITVDKSSELESFPSTGFRLFGNL